MHDTSDQVGIKDIARALKVSIGTVDRALHNRSGVSEHTKARVLQRAAELGYRPNLAAQALKLNRRISIAAVLPKEISYFFDPLRAGIRTAAAAPISTQVSLEFHEYPRAGVGEEEAFAHAVQRHYDGIIFLPGNMRRFDPIIRKLTRAGTAMMCVSSDAPNSDRIGSIAAHSYVSGSMAAELLALRLGKRGNVAVFSGELSMMDHAEKLRGFAATLAVQAPHLSLLPALESHERPKDAYRQARQLMQARNRPEGLYLSTANSMPVLQALDELGMLGKVSIVTTDLYHELVPLIELGKVLATLHQRPFTQGKLAFEQLLAYLLRDDKRQPFIRLAPHIVFRSNLSLFSGDIPERQEDIESELRPRREG
ncbi:LacI family DNA-binding transcriptional regulator [Edaphobacter paludis]|uniref:LacI family DNA-binding transcriptional regulator n=1 Tax=Edaphobacter paludis TaxID=3035702 RepID=A0AAU7D849_9BACT